MLRSRVIRPGIVTNEELAALGPYAEILFTRLWMLADRDGLLEDRPRRIKAEAMPYYDVDVENLLENLRKSGFILRYRTRDKRALICIIEFRKHQYIHPHEPKSVLPAPPSRNGNRASDRKQAGSLQDTDVSNVITCQDAAVTSPDIVDTCTLVSFSFLNTKSGGELYTPCEQGTPVEKSPPPPENEDRKPSAPAISRKAPERAKRPREKAQSKHASDDVDLMRDSLAALAHEIRMPPPDDGIVERVLDAGNGATAVEIHETLCALHKRHKFRDMRSWGFLPVVVGDAFSRAACG